MKTKLKDIEVKLAKDIIDFIVNKWINKEEINIGELNKHAEKLFEQVGKEIDELIEDEDKALETHIGITIAAMTRLKKLHIIVKENIKKGDEKKEMSVNEVYEILAQD